VKIHHLGIVVSDIEEALVSLGLQRSDIAEEIYDENQKNKLYFIHVPDNNMWLELVEPVDKDSTTAKFAKKFTIGLHHLAMENDDLTEVENKYTSRVGNFVLGKYQIKVDSFGGTINTLFVAVKGMILEFVKVEKK